MIRQPSRRDTLKSAAKLAAASLLGADYGAAARAEEPTRLGVNTFSQIDSMLRVATGAEEVPGVVALAAPDKGIVYEGIFGRRRAARQAPASRGAGDDARYRIWCRLDGQTDDLGRRAAARRAGQAFT